MSSGVVAARRRVPSKLSGVPASVPSSVSEARFTRPVSSPSALSLPASMRKLRSLPSRPATTVPQTSAESWCPLGATSDSNGRLDSVTVSGPLRMSSGWAKPSDRDRCAARSSRALPWSPSASSSSGAGVISPRMSAGTDATIPPSPCAMSTAPLAEMSWPMPGQLISCRSICRLAARSFCACSASSRAAGCISAPCASDPDIVPLRRRRPAVGSGRFAIAQIGAPCAAATSIEADTVPAPKGSCTRPVAWMSKRPSGDASSRFSRAASLLNSSPSVPLLKEVPATAGSVSARLLSMRSMPAADNANCTKPASLVEPWSATFTLPSLTMKLPLARPSLSTVACSRPDTRPSGASA
jgi:hypothetical protein